MAHYKAPPPPVTKRMVQSPVLGFTLLFLGITAGVYLYLTRTKYKTYSSSGLTIQVDPRAQNTNPTSADFETPESEGVVATPAPNAARSSNTQMANALSRAVASDSSQNSKLKIQSFEVKREEAAKLMMGSSFIGEMDRIKAYLLPESADVSKALALLKPIAEKSSSKADELSFFDLLSGTALNDPEAQGLNLHLSTAPSQTSPGLKANLTIERNLKIDGALEAANFEMADQDWPKASALVIIGLVPRKASQILKAKREGMFKILDSQDYLEGRSLLLVVIKQSGTP